MPSSSRRGNCLCWCSDGGIGSRVKVYLNPTVLVEAKSKSSRCGRKARPCRPIRCVTAVRSRGACRTSRKYIALLVSSAMCDDKRASRLSVPCSFRRLRSVQSWTSGTHQASTSRSAIDRAHLQCMQCRNKETRGNKNKSKYQSFSENPQDINKPALCTPPQSQLV